MLLKITLLIFKLSSDLSIRVGLSASPNAVLVCRFKNEYSDESLIDTSPIKILSQRIHSFICDMSYTLYVILCTSIYFQHNLHDC
jgi:hypothetical protein